MFLFFKVEYLVFKSGCWRFETHLLGWGWLWFLEAPPLSFGAAFHLGFFSLYHWMSLNLDTYSTTLTPGTYSDFLNNFDSKTNQAPYISPKSWVHAMIWYKCILFKKWYSPFQPPNHTAVPYLLPITKIHSMLVSTFVKITRIHINSRSLYTKTYGIEMLHTWINSR